MSARVDLIDKSITSIESALAAITKLRQESDLVLDVNAATIGVIRSGLDVSIRSLRDIKKQYELQGN